MTIIKRDHVRLEAPSERARAVASPQAACAEAGVSLLEEGGRVVALEVRCRCGESTVVELEYDAGAADRAPASPDDPARDQAPPREAE